MSPRKAKRQILSVQVLLIIGPASRLGSAGSPLNFGLFSRFGSRFGAESTWEVLDSDLAELNESFALIGLSMLMLVF